MKLDANSAVKIPIPNPGTPLFDERVTLNGIDYILRFDWHQREERWYLDIQDATGTVITGGIKLVSSWLLYSRETLPQAPQGNFSIVDPESLPPQLADFGLRSLLLFWPAV